MGKYGLSLGRDSESLGLGSSILHLLGITKAEPFPKAAKDHPGAPFGEPSPPLGVSVDGLSFLPSGRAEILHLG